MLSAHSLKAQVFKHLDGGPPGAADRYLFYTCPQPSRGFAKLHALFVEGDLRQLWQQTKQRLRAQLQDAYTACQPGTAKRGSAVAAAELQPLYGSDGPLRAAVMYLLAHASRSFMTLANSTEVAGGQHMAAALARQTGRPLITVCNHVASMDDPLVMSTILPPAAFSDPTQLRWTLCASDRCFQRQLLVPFFRAAKVLPVERGAGMFQAGLAAAEERLQQGDWVHIFPEGTRSRDGRMGPVRKGVGRLVAACAGADPVILPFVHSGMEGVLPKGSLLPKTNQQVRVLVGEPIDVSDLFAAAQAQGWPEDQLYSRIANRIGGRMAALKAALDGSPLDAAAQHELQQAVLEQGLDLYDPVDNAHRAASLWERVSFRSQHRHWATQGLSAAKARLAAAAASLSSSAAEGGASSSSSSSSGLLGPGQAAAAAAAGPPGGRAASKLAIVKQWLSPEGARSSDYYSYQRSVAMMQLLQSRV